MSEITLAKCTPSKNNIFISLPFGRDSISSVKTYNILLYLFH